MFRSVARIGFALVALATLAFGLMMVRDGLRARDENLRAEVAEPFAMIVDVGATGTHLATLHQTAGFTCKQVIELTIDLREGEDAEALLRGLELSVSVTDSRGVEVLSGTYPPRFMWSTVGDSIVLVREIPMPRGEYAVKVKVYTPAPGLAGRPIRVSSRYELCEVELLAVPVGLGLGASGLTVGVIIVVVLGTTSRKRAGPRPGAAEPPAGASA